MAALWWSKAMTRIWPPHLHQESRLLLSARRRDRPLKLSFRPFRFLRAAVPTLILARSHLPISAVYCEAIHFAPCSRCCYDLEHLSRNNKLNKIRFSRPARGLPQSLSLSQSARSWPARSMRRRTARISRARRRRRWRRLSRRLGRSIRLPQGFAMKDSIIRTSWTRWITSAT